MQRTQRKLEHIKYALQLGDGPDATHFEDLRFLHNCLPELNTADIDLSAEILGKRLRLPFFIDAVTGSADAVTDINRKLAQTAARMGIGMAVGSQFGAVRSGTGLASYAVVREEYPDGLIFANISALATPQQAQAAVAMLHADALEIHLNAAQELWMPEGDKDNRGSFANMRKIREQLSVPVIVKETGCGIAAEEYTRLLDAGFTCFNCAGAGGTNFAAIEAARAGQVLTEDFLRWGLPTCWSLLDAQAVPANKLLLASGGIRSGAQAARALALGADAVCVTGPVLRLVVEQDVSAAVAYLQKMADELRSYMQLLGCAQPCELRRTPLVISGVTKNYIDCRGYDLVKICRSRRIKNKFPTLNACTSPRSS